ncbi:hypothetical protein G6F68_019502 [Rhizopus microsporus]|nr:hypothetical protein G6F68_019502 [Rhizopus microsporus]
MYYLIVYKITYFKLLAIKSTLDGHTTLSHKYIHDQKDQHKSKYHIWSQSGRGSTYAAATKSRNDTTQRPIIATAAATNLTVAASITAAATARC